MEFRVPKTPLDAHIELLWHCEEREASHDRERVLPDGSVELLFPIAEAPLRIYEATTFAPLAVSHGALISGPQARPFVIDTAARASLIGVHFKPGGAFAVLGLPLDLLFNRHVPLDDVWGAFGSELLDQLRSASSAEDRLLRLERGLVARMRASRSIPGPVVCGLRAFLAHPRSARVDEVARDMGLSARRLSQLFREAVGMPPERYARLSRLQSALAMASPEVSWSRIAYGCGYYDQSHFINEFREFTGTHPHRYFAERTTEANHLMVAAAERTSPR